jgi:hypothetical protein
MSENGSIQEHSSGLIMLSDDPESSASNQGQQTPALTPEMVRQVADRVYRLLLQEARIDFERRRPPYDGRRIG